MTRDELLRLRANAESESVQLAQSLEALFAAARDSNSDDEHDPEGATIGFERAQLTSLLAAARRRIAELDEALHRMDAGRYGGCERCGQPIAEERLAALPFARCCIACA